MRGGIHDAVVCCGRFAGFWATAVCFVVVVLSACTNESYDSGTGALSLTRADFVEAHTDDGCAVDYAFTDDGLRIVLIARPTVEGMDVPDTLYRAVLYYNVYDDYAIPSLTSIDLAAKAVGLSMVPVLYPKDAGGFKNGIHTDPVKFESIWLSENGRYINMGFYLKTGRPDADDALHTIGLAYTGTTVNADGTRTAAMTFYHDRGGMPEYYFSRYYVSVPCDEIDDDSVRITVNTYDGGLVTKTLRISPATVK